MRFFYCRNGLSPFQVFLVNNDESKPLWSPPKDEHISGSVCEWRKASAIIPPGLKPVEFFVF